MKRKIDTPPMVNDPHILDSLPAYVLGSLEEDEAHSVAEHLAGCVVCRSELDAYQKTADFLLLAVPGASPAQDLKPRLMERIQAAGKPSVSTPKASRPANAPFYRRLVRASMWAGALLIILLAVSSLLLWQRLENLEVLNGPLGMRAVALQNTGNAPQASGIVIIGSDGENGVLVVDKLQLLDADHEYQVWLIRDGEQVSGAVFNVDEDGYRGMRLQPPESLWVYSSVLVTIEPAGGSAAPTGTQVLSGSLFNR